MIVVILLLVAWLYVLWRIDRWEAIIKDSQEEK